MNAHFFATMGMPVLLGRGIEESDCAGGPQIAVINERLAQAYFPHESPIGRHFQAQPRDYQIIGVVRDGRYDEIRREIPPTFSAAIGKTRQASIGSPSN